jgi:hypothetical protein
MKRIFPDHAKSITRALAGLGKADRLTATRLLKRLGRAEEELDVEEGTG